MSFYEGDIFVGFMCIIKSHDIVNILYFAISKEFQGHGYGHEALELVKQKYKGYRFIADIEKDEENCPNQSARKKRELFYLHDDYKESGIEYNYRGIDYVIMVANGSISKKEFKDFWSSFSEVDDLGHYIKHNFQID